MSGEEVEGKKVKSPNCPRCGRFMRVFVGQDDAWCVLLGRCSKDGIFYVFGEFKAEGI